MPNYHPLPGAIALSPFRKVQLLDLFIQHKLPIKKFDAQYYFLYGQIKTF
jgi:phosphoribosylformylglycinamidine synthase